MNSVLLVFLGGGVGSALSYGAGLAVASTTFPYATFAVNAIGSLAIGLFGGWAARFGWSDEMRLLLTTGLCGGFTTFSTFSKESLALIEGGRYSLFVFYVAGSVALGIIAAGLGFWIVK